VGGRGRAAFFGADPRRVAAGMACTILGIGLVVGTRAHARSFVGHPVRPVVLASATPVPPGSLALYQAGAASCPGLSWTVLFAISEVETRHGTFGTTSPAGAVGPMQFLPATWKAYATDGDGDGRVDIDNQPDSVMTAARMLCANGGGIPSQLATAIWSYNHSWQYVARVLSLSAALPSG